MPNSHEGFDALRRLAPRSRRSLLGRIVAAFSGFLWSSRKYAHAQDADARRVFALRARDYRFEPAAIDVRENDLVVVDLDAEDIPHSFAVDAYRIVKRASPGRPARFEFRADKVGTFPFYCNLTADDRCKGMRGQLTVRPR